MRREQVYFSLLISSSNFLSTAQIALSSPPPYLFSGQSLSAGCTPRASSLLATTPASLNPGVSIVYYGFDPLFKSLLSSSIQCWPPGEATRNVMISGVRQFISENSFDYWSRFQLAWVRGKMAILRINLARVKFGTPIEPSWSSDFTGGFKLTNGRRLPVNNWKWSVFETVKPVSRRQAKLGQTFEVILS